MREGDILRILLPMTCKGTRKRVRVTVAHEQIKMQDRSSIKVRTVSGLSYMQHATCTMLSSHRLNIRKK